MGHMKNLTMNKQTHILLDEKSLHVSGQSLQHVVVETYQCSHHKDVLG